MIARTTTENIRERQLKTMCYEHVHFSKMKDNGLFKQTNKFMLLLLGELHLITRLSNFGKQYIADTGQA